MNGKSGSNFLKIISAWATLALFALCYVAENKLIALNPRGASPWPQGFPHPTTYDAWLWVRNAALVLTFVAGLYSFPRWQSVMGMTFTIVYFVYAFVVLAK